MEKKYIQNQTFQGEDFTIHNFSPHEYEDCHFISCVFSHVDLAQTDFIACRFEHCDLSMANLKNTAIRETNFTHCKMLGLRFEDCNPFLLSFDFEDCILNFSSFYNQKLKGVSFKNASDPK